MISCRSLSVGWRVVRVRVSQICYVTVGVGPEVIVTNRYKGSGPEKHQIERYVTVNVYFQGWHVT